jgi:hypothetical protein
MKYYYFIDESGDHGLSFVDKNFPLFLLNGILVDEQEYLKLSTALNDFKQKYFCSSKVILHSRDIRKYNNEFQILFDLDLKKQFYADLNVIIGSAVYKIIAAGIDKEEFIKKYGKGAKNPYLISTSFLLERMIYCLDNLGNADSVEIFIESRGGKEDALLLEYLNKIKDSGSYYVPPQRFTEKIKKIHFRKKQENDAGLQLADLIAYPLARYLLDTAKTNPAMDIFKPKIYADSKGVFIGWGVKLFP